MELLGRKWNGAETARSWRVPNMDEEGESPLGNGFGYPTEDLSPTAISQVSTEKAGRMARSADSSFF